MYALQLLGPVRLTHRGEAVALPTLKVQALLVLLALGGPAHRARVATWLWPALDEPSGRRNLRRELARLRELGHARLLVAQGEVLALEESVACDARVFERALQEGQSETALAHWQGPPADGLAVDGSEAFAEWLSGERRRLLARRREALGAAADAHEAAGRFDAALQHVETLLADDPLHEGAHRRAMQLHAAAGRREAALTQHARCRELLAAELGIAPTAETEALAAALRGGTEIQGVAASDGRAAANDDRPPVPAEPWSSEMPLTGRDDALAALAAGAARGRTLLVQGEAGIGKTRLAREFAQRRGPCALAQCRRSDTAVPYASFTRALRLLASETLAQAGLPSWVAGELARLLPELGPAPPSGMTAEDRHRFFTACSQAWQVLADGSFDTVVIDDWHLADPASRELFDHIASQRAEGRMPGAPQELWVFRAELDAEARAMLRSLAEAGRACAVELAPWTEAETLQLLRRLSPGPDPRLFAQRLQRATGGHPFFVAETLRHWHALRPVAADEAAAELRLPVPDSVLEAVLARVRRLPEQAQRLLEAAALAREPFPPALLAGACAMSEIEALAAIEHAVAARLLVEREGAAGAPPGWAFAHDLVQMALEGQLGAARRRSVHRRLALGAEATLAQLGAKAVGVEAADIARHWEAGGEPQRAVEHRLAAAEGAVALFADGVAGTHWQAALADGPTPAQRLRLLSARGAMERRIEDESAMLRTLADLDALRDEARQAGDSELALGATVEAVHLLSVSNRGAEALQRIDECLAEPIDAPDWLARALQVGSQALNGVGRTADALAMARRALALDGLAPSVQAQLLHSQAYSHYLRDEPAEALACARRTLSLWHRAGEHRRLIQAHANIGLFLALLGDDDAACESYAVALQGAEQQHHGHVFREVANNLACTRLKQGRSADALAVVERALGLSQQFGRRSQFVYLTGQKVQAHTQRGELGAALDCAAAAWARALEIDETLTLADAVSMSLDLHGFVGDRDAGDRLLAALQGRSMAGLDYMRIKLVFNQVLHALRFEGAPVARAHLDTLGEIDRLAQPVDRVSGALASAQVLLAEGLPAEALRWLDAWEPQAAHVETRLAMAEWRLRITPGAPEAMRRAHELLREPASAMHALSLRAVLLQQAPAPERAALAAAQAAAVQAMACSLERHPPQRASFLRQWAPHGHAESAA